MKQLPRESVGMALTAFQEYAYPHHRDNQHAFWMRGPAFCDRPATPNASPDSNSIHSIATILSNQEKASARALSVTPSVLAAFVSVGAKVTRLTAAVCRRENACTASLEKWRCDKSVEAHVSQKQAQPTPKKKAEMQGYRGQVLPYTTNIHQQTLQTIHQQTTRNTDTTTATQHCSYAPQTDRSL
jgi:hypothetical protein